MAQAATSYFFVNPKHTGGRFILSDILVPGDLMDRLYMAGLCPANDTCIIIGDDDDDDEYDLYGDDDFDDDDGFAAAGEEFMDLDDELDPLLLWRGPKRGS